MSPHRVAAACQPVFSYLYRYISLLQIVIILRGPPGSGKTHVARLIKVSLR